VTVLASIGSASIPAGSANVAFSGVAAGATEIRLTLTHSGLPEIGSLIIFEVTFGGQSQGRITCGGVIPRLKNGTPTGGSDVLVFVINKRPGQTSGTVSLKVAQAFTAAILVEAF
jgi:hypothetical protein